MGGSATWNISGSDSNGCTYSGSAAFTISEANGAPLYLQFQLLPGSRHFLGYQGPAGPDPGAEISYTRHCPNQDPEVFTGGPGYFFDPDGETPIQAGGLLAGSQTIDEGGGATTTYAWNLSPSALP